jgi:hypothetical protein
MKRCICERCIVTKACPAEVWCSLKYAPVKFSLTAEFSVAELRFVLELARRKICIEDLSSILDRGSKIKWSIEF